MFDTCEGCMFFSSTESVVVSKEDRSELYCANYKAHIVNPIGCCNFRPIKLEVRIIEDEQ